MTEGAFTPGSPAESDEYLAAVRGNEENPPPFIALVGYYEVLSDLVRARLYSTLDLDSYVEFDVDAVVGHSVNVVGPVTGTTIWLRLDAEVTFSAHFKFEDLETKVLKGSITRWFLPRLPREVYCPISDHHAPGDRQYEGEW